MVECGGLENRCPGNRIESSNLSLSAIFKEIMLKLKLILVALFIPLFIFLLLVGWRMKEKYEYPHKIVLAKEIRKVMDRMMIDVREAKQSSIREVPTDGKWHKRNAFDKVNEGMVEYVVVKDRQLVRLTPGRAETIANHIAAIRIRRPTKEADVLEIQIEAKKDISLMSNFKIRVRN